MYVYVIREDINCMSSRLDPISVFSNYMGTTLNSVEIQQSPMKQHRFSNDQLKHRQTPARENEPGEVGLDNSEYIYMCVYYI